jgi:hypothetical protein
VATTNPCGPGEHGCSAAIPGKVTIAEAARSENTTAAAVALVDVCRGRTDATTSGSIG